MFAISVGICLFISFQASAALNITVYYEALCYDSVRFIRDQLNPTFEDFSNYVNLEFVPFGKAFIDDSKHPVVISCQHGPLECSGNKYQSCILNQDKGQLQNLRVVNCIMSSSNPSHPLNIERCVQSLNYNWTKVKDCFENGEGDKLIHLYGNKTMNLDPNISFVPTIVFDGKFDFGEQQAALFNFESAVCHKLKTAPQKCIDKGYTK